MNMSYPIVDKKLLVTLATAAIALSSLAQPFTAAYNFGSVTTSSGLTDPTPPPAAVGVSFGSFSAVGYVGNPNAGSRFSFQTNGLGGIDADNNFANFTGSLNSGKYFEVTLTPQAGFTLNLYTIAFTIQRSGTGIRSYAVRSSLDSFAANLSATINPANVALTVGPGDEFRIVTDATTTAQNGSLVALSPAFDTLLSPVTFRFYGWNAEGDGGTFSIDNVAFSGSVTAVPEPSAAAIGLLAAVGLFARRFANRN
jgi:hypothetical protein